ncbi:MAG: 3'-5' exonuclease [Leeuwenhoekiella sp.]
MGLLSFFKSRPKNLPEFYQEYAAKFTSSPGLKDELENIRLVSFDTETTGLDTKNDRILSIGAVLINGNRIEVSEVFECFLEQRTFNAESVAIHGILKMGKRDKISEETAIQKFLVFVGNSVLVGHHVGFDIAMINQALKRLGAPKLKNRPIDTASLYKRSIHTVNRMSPQKVYSLDDLCAELKIPKEDRHKATGDAYITAIAYLKIYNRLKNNKLLRLKDL